MVEWSGLLTPIQPEMAVKKGEITVKEASNIFWLGPAKIFIDENNHITKGVVQLNTRLLAVYGPAAADHVLRQELGHVLGLDHQRDALDSCMNDQAVLGSAGGPNAHDAEQLGPIYAHTDSVEDDDGGGPPCDRKPDHLKCQAPQGRWLTVDIFPIPEGD